MALLQRRPVVALLSLLAGGVASAADAWEPAEALREEGEAFLIRWNTLIQEGRFEEAYADLAPATKVLVTVKQWADLQRAIRTQTGAAEGRSVRRIRWFENPTRAKRPGVYLVAEYDCAYERDAKRYEVVVLHQPPDAGFNVNRYQNRAISNRSTWLVAAT